MVVSRLFLFFSLSLLLLCEDMYELLYFYLCKVDAMRVCLLIMLYFLYCNNIIPNEHDTNPASSFMTMTILSPRRNTCFK